MTLWLLVIVMALASYRLTRIVVADTFPPAYWLRERIVLGTADTRWESWGELWQCPWCMGWWVSGAVVLVTDLTHGMPVPLLVWPAVAAVAALLSQLEQALDREAN